MLRGGGRARWLLGSISGFILSCTTASEVDPGGTETPPSCATRVLDPPACASSSLLPSAGFRDLSGASIAGRWPAGPLRVAASFQNPSATDVTLRSPDCILKEWWVDGAAIGVNATADCFAPTELLVPARGSASLESADIDATNLGAGPLVATLTLWTLDDTDTLQVCSLCADGLTLE